MMWLDQEVAAPSQISPAAVAALCAALNAADFGDSTGSGVSGVPGPGVCGVPGPGVSGVAGVSGVPAAAHPKQVTPPRTLNWRASTALEVALQVMVLCKSWISRTSHHATKANHCEPRLQVTSGVVQFFSDLPCSAAQSCILATANSSSGVLLAESLEGSAQSVCVCTFSKEVKPVFRLDDLLPECILFQLLSLASIW